MIKWRKKMLGWVKRYGYGEFIALCCSYLGYMAVILLSGDHLILAAYVSSLAETIGYYLVILFREFLFDYQEIKQMQGSYSVKRFLYTYFHLLTEFGPAELLDTLIFRPLSIDIGVRLFGISLGILAGKIVGDVLFYIPVICSYELHQYLRKKENK